MATAFSSQHASSRRHSTVVVVGAGPTGLTAATDLLRRGVAVRVLDRAERANPHAKAVVLWPRALEVFDRLGIADEIRDLAVPITAANYFAGRRRMARIRFGALADTRFGVPLSLPQNVTESVLRRAFEAAGGVIEYGHNVSDIQSDNDGVTAAEFTADWVIGCDGAHSAIRTGAGIRFIGAPYPQSYALVDGHWNAEFAHSESFYFMHPDGVLVLVGLPGGLTRAFVSVPAEANPTADLDELVADLAHRRCPQPLSLTQATGSGRFTVQRRLAERFRSGRVLLAGDAAHVHSPAGGQGLNTSVQDAHELAWRLADVIAGRRSATVLDEWATERRHVAATVVRDTDRQTRLWTAAGWRATARDTAMRVGEQIGLIDRVLPRRLAQLDLAYPNPGRRLDGLRPGDRLPNPIAGGARLHPALVTDRTVLALLASADEPPDWLAQLLDDLADAVPALRIPRPAVAQALRIRRPTVALIRPDAVVAFAARLDATDLPARLRQQLSPPEHGLFPVPTKEYLS